MGQWHAAQVPIEKWAAFFNDYVTHMGKLNPDLKFAVLEQENGRDIVHLKRKLPWPMSDRSMITVFYRKQCEDGSFYFGYTTKPCADLAQKHAKIWKGDELADAEMCFHAVAHANGGTKVRFRVSMDPKGNVPSAMKTKMATKQQGFLDNIAKYIADNKL